MGVEVKSVKVEHKVDFDVIIDGEYQKRVCEGILFARENNGVTTYVGASQDLLFAALVGLTLFVTENNLDDEFQKFLKNNME